MKPLTQPRNVSVPDSLLVDRIRRGNDDAFQTLYHRHYDYIERILLRLMGDTDVLEDVLQETFLGAVQHICDLRDGEKVRSWLTAIAINAARRYLTRRKRRSLVPREAVDESAGPDAAYDPISLDRVYAALDKISPKLRIPWMLHKVEEMTLPEVAATCRTSRSTVKRRIAAAEARLRRLLDVT